MTINRASLRTLAACLVLAAAFACGSTALCARPLFGVGLTDSVTVTKLLPGSLAAKAGLRAGDRIVIFDGQQISRAAQLTDLIKHAGARYVPMVVQRGSATRALMAQMPAGDQASAAAFFNRRIPDARRHRAAHG